MGRHLEGWQWCRPVSCVGACVSGTHTHDLAGLYVYVQVRARTFASSVQQEEVGQLWCRHLPARCHHISASISDLRTMNEPSGCDCTIGTQQGSPCCLPSAGGSMQTTPCLDKPVHVPHHHHLTAPHLPSPPLQSWSPPLPPPRPPPPPSPLPAPLPPPAASPSPCTAPPLPPTWRASPAAAAWTPTPCPPRPATPGTTSRWGTRRRRRSRQLLRSPRWVVVQEWGSTGTL